MINHRPGRTVTGATRRPLDIRTGEIRVCRGRQGEVHAGAAAGVVGGVDVSAVPFHDAVTDGESEPGAAVRPRGVGAVEAGEDRGVLAGGDADAAITDLHVDLTFRSR